MILYTFLYKLKSCKVS